MTARKKVTVSEDILMNVAFFLPDWATFELFYQALSPWKVLETLDNLWHLQSLGWASGDVWPCLNLTKMNESSRSHVEAIAPYYSKVVVTEKTDAVWFRQFVLPTASIDWRLSRKFLRRIDLKHLKPWKKARITSIDLHRIASSDLNEALSYLKYLEVVQLPYCTTAMASLVFQYAATSANLRELILGTTDDCTITTSMAGDLIKWISSQPIRRLELEYFTWESQNQRLEVAKFAFRTPTIEIFRIKEFLLTTEGVYNRRQNSLSLTFDDLQSGLSSYDPPPPMIPETLDKTIELFQPLCLSQLESLRIAGLSTKNYRSLWKKLTPFLQEAPIKVLEMEHKKFHELDAVPLTEAIRNHRTLQELNFSKSVVESAAAKTLLTCLPQSVKKISLGIRRGRCREIVDYNRSPGSITVGSRRLY
ncbi:hypothetical protein AC1031_011392 [Aphanomyces cochlioides]|nr:hypothetical protein AC1031_011392 [Aphanomyces cochlioides]